MFMKYKFLTLLIIACMSTIPTFAATAYEAVQAWLVELDNKNYQSTWENSAPFFRDKISVKKWQRMARSARKPLGKLQTRELLGAVYKDNLPAVPPGDYVIFQFRSSFSNRDNVIETVTPTLVDGAWQVGGYYVK